MDLINIKGIGNKKKEILINCGISNCLDLVYYFPKNFFYSKEGFFTIGKKNFFCGSVLINKSLVLRFSKGIKLYATITLNSKTSDCEILFFRQAYLKNTLKKGVQINILGEYKTKGGILSFMSPKWNMNKDLNSLTGMLPQYRPLDSIKTNELEKYIKQSIELSDESDLKLKYVLCNDYKKLFYDIHFPRNPKILAQAKEYFLLERMIEYLLKVKVNRKKSSKFFLINSYFDILDEFKSILPYNLSASQTEVLNNISKYSGSSFDVLLHGEVGSGKTIVAFLLCCIYIKSGYQTAFMSPTESLCYQTYSKFINLFSKISAFLITRSTPKNEIKNALNYIKKGKPTIIFGTHKIISNNFEFKNLKLVIIDEQQKFGVNQRKKLINKASSGKNINPDVLLMSATPIPRTLALILSSGYKIEKILPHNIPEIETLIINPKKIDTLFRKVRREIEKGFQGYFVCPRIFGDDINSIETILDFIKKSQHLNNCKIEVLTGKMTGEQKQNIYNDYLNKKIDILLATGVIEVGIDVKNANFMIVFDANRFGLSQLHQLRGRIGRGNNVKNYFFLVPALKNIKKNIESINVLKKFNDGYKIAFHDMNNRGIGEIFGVKQHGNFDLILDDLIERNDLLEKAVQIVKNIEPDSHLKDDAMITL